MFLPVYNPSLNSEGYGVEFLPFGKVRMGFNKEM